MQKLSALLVSLFILGACSAVEDVSDVSQNAIGPATVSTDANTYIFNDKVTVSWSGLNGNATDWVAIAPAGSSLTTITRWAYTNGTASGSGVFEGPSTGGSYVARAFDNDTYTLMGESDPFTYQDPGSVNATVTLDQPDYAISQDIVVSYSGMPGSTKDWISISAQGASDTTPTMWKYTGGGTSGTVTFSLGLGPSGRKGGSNYVARAFVNDSYVKVAETAPVLIGANVTTNASTYAAHQTVTVSWTHLPGGSGDWIAIAPQGSAPEAFTTWMYTGGAQNGSVTFQFGVPTTGTYVARAMSPEFYYIAGESAPFTVTPAAAVTVTTDASTYGVGQDITVTWTGTPGNQRDWIAIAPTGSPNSTTTRWVYTNGQVNGSFTFEGVDAGTYEARAFLDDRYVRIGTSAPFTVQ